MKKDYYTILGLSKKASDEDIKQRYRQLAHEHHPDKNDGNKISEGRFKEIQEAYNVLKDPKQREKYLNTESNHSYSDSYNTPHQTYDEMDRLIHEMYASFFDSYRPMHNYSRKQSKSSGDNHIHYDLSGL